MGGGTLVSPAPKLPARARRSRPALAKSKSQMMLNKRRWRTPVMTGVGELEGILKKSDTHGSLPKWLRAVASCYSVLAVREKTLDLPELR